MSQINRVYRRRASRSAVSAAAPRPRARLSGSVWRLGRLALGLAGVVWALGQAPRVLPFTTRQGGNPYWLLLMLLGLFVLGGLKTAFLGHSLGRLTGDFD